MEEKTYPFSKKLLIELCALCTAEGFGYAEDKIGKPYDRVKIETDMFILMQDTINAFLTRVFSDDV